MNKTYERISPIQHLANGPSMQPEYIAQANEFVNLLLGFDVDAQNEAFAHIHKRLIESRESRLNEIDQQITNLKEQYEDIATALKYISK